MTAKTVTHNPWITSIPVAVHITAEDIERRRADLYAWSIEHQRPLPMPAEWIISLELRGFVVDLVTGQRMAADATHPPIFAEVTR